MKKYEREWLKKELLENGKTLREIGEILGVSKQRVYQWCQKEKIFISKERRACWYAKRKKIKELESPEWLLEKLHQKNLSLKSLAKSLKVSETFLILQMKRLGLDPQDFTFKAIRMKITCDFCGKLFERKASLIKRTKYHFCSRSCLGHWLGEHNKNWSKEEIEFIKRNWKEMSDRELARHLPKRSKAAVASYRKKVLKLQRRPKPKRWTQKEEEFIKKNWQKMSDEEMAEFLGRSEIAVSFRRRKLNLKRS